MVSPVLDGFHAWHVINSVSSGSCHCVFREDIFLFDFHWLDVVRESMMGIEASFLLKNIVGEKNIWSAFQHGNNHEGKCYSRYFP